MTEFTFLAFSSQSLSFGISGFILLFSTVIIMISLRDFVRAGYQSIFGLMVAAFTFVHGYGYFIYPILPRTAFDEKLFDYAIYNRMGVGLLLILITLLFLIVIKALLMPAHPRHQASGVVPSPTGFNVLFVALVVYSILYFFQNMDKLWDLARVIITADYRMYYDQRLDNIHTRAGRNPIINNLNALMVGAVAPFLLSVLSFQYFRHKKMLGYFVIVAGITLLSSLMRFQKAPVIIWLMILGLSYLYAKDIIAKKRIPVIKIAILGGVFVLCISFVYSLLGHQGGFFDAIYRRIMLSSIFTSYGHFYVFPDLHPFVHYAGSRTFNILYGFGQDTTFHTGYGTPPLIAGLLFRGHAFNMNTSILGDSYAHNGYLGNIQGALIYFGFFVALDVFYARSKKLLPYAPVVIFFIPEFITVLNSGMGAVIGRYYFLIPVMYLFAFKPAFRR